MAEDIKDLIEKINQEGVKAAEEKAQRIEAEARQKAEAILARAKIEAGEIISAAHERIRREDERERALLAQAGRDLLLSLREEINAMLGRIVISDLRQALTPEALSRLMSEVVRNFNTAERSDITVSLNKKDLELLEQHYLDTLRQETRRNIILKHGEEIQKGFTISFDNGKSCYDFTDKALADYIGTYLKPKLHRILQEAVEE
jgi:vacuolar-type H+-ATPase subunit E/Vma4